MLNENKKKVAIIGGGAAGFFTAIEAACQNPQLVITIFEATGRTLTKVKASGGGRCNVTHHLFEPKALSERYPRGAKELHQAFHHFQPRDTIAWFAARGVQLKVEDDGRMFPTTDKSETIVQCFADEVARLGITVRTMHMVEQVACDEQGRFALHMKNGESFAADASVIATGSIPAGHAIAQSLGHTIVDPVPSLFTALIDDPLLQDLAGISFQEAQLTLALGKETFRTAGPLLITHWGLSGPAQLKLSAFAARALHGTGYLGTLIVNWIGLPPAEALTQLKEWRETRVPVAPAFGIAQRFWDRLLAIAGIRPQTWADVSNAQMQAMVAALTQTKLSLQGQSTYKKEFTVAGGVARHEIDFRTMQSKCTPNLYFAGEVLDIDGITGGFNFQNAWTGGFLIAKHLRAPALLP